MWLYLQETITRAQKIQTDVRNFTSSLHVSELWFEFHLPGDGHSAANTPVWTCLHVAQVCLTEKAKWLMSSLFLFSHISTFLHNHEAPVRNWGNKPFSLTSAGSELDFLTLAASLECKESHKSVLSSLFRLRPISTSNKGTNVITMLKRLHKGRGSTVCALCKITYRRNLPVGRSGLFLKAACWSGSTFSSRLECRGSDIKVISP